MRKCGKNISFNFLEASVRTQRNQVVEAHCPIPTLFKLVRHSFGLRAAIYKVYR